MRFLTSSSLLLLLLQLAVAAPEVIGPEALRPVLSRSTNTWVVTFRPASDEVVDINPPMFSWSYTPDPYAHKEASMTPRTFRLQVSTNSECTNGFVADINTPWNCYAFLGLFNTNMTHYWRVIYTNPASAFYTNWTLADGSWNTNAYATSSVRSFTIAPDALEWDRSNFTNTTFMASRAQHPHMMFTATNLAAVRDYVTVTQASAWATIQASADSTITNSWWPNGTPSHTNIANAYVNETWGAKIAEVAFCYQMTGDAKYTNCVTAVTNLAWWMYTNNTSVDWTLYGDWFLVPHKILYRDLSLGYDWMYEILNSDQRTNIRKTFQQRSRWCLYQGFSPYIYLNPTTGSTDTGDPSHLWTSCHVVNYSSMMKWGSSHPVSGNFYDSLPGALASYGEETNSAKFLDFALNYFLCLTYPWDYGEGTVDVGGRGYALLWLLGDDDNRCGYQSVLAGSVFPDMQLQNTPFLRKSLDWLISFTPSTNNNIFSTWGEGGNGSTWIRKYSSQRFLDICTFLGNGSGYRLYTNAPANPADDPMTYEHIVFPYYWGTPSASNTPLINFKESAGWYLESSLPANTPVAFLDGVGLQVQARPSGCNFMHDGFTDGSFDIWAYGAKVTEGGGYYMNAYGDMAFANYAVLLNGIGQAQPSTFTPGIGSVAGKPYYNRFSAYTNTATYTYVCLDLKNGYPTNTMDTYAQSVAYPSCVFTEVPLKTAGVQTINRHILFMRGKYVVVMDDLICASNLVLSTVYHTDPSVFDLSNGSFNYVAKNLWGVNSNVFVKVWQNVEPDTLYVTNMVLDIASGATNVARNPLTGQDGGRSPVNGTVSGYYGTTDFSLWRTNAIWTSSKWATTNFQLLWVIYPWRDSNNLPTIARVDNLTVAITNGADADVISFNSNAAATLQVSTGYRLATLTPTYNPDSGEYYGWSTNIYVSNVLHYAALTKPNWSTYPQDVTISTKDAGDDAWLFWSFNGSDWMSTNSSNSVVTITNAGTTLWSYATNAGKADSKVMRRTYQYPQVASPRYFPAPASYPVSSTNVFIYCDTAGADVVWSTNNWTNSYTLPSGNTMTLALSNKNLLQAYGSMAGMIPSFTNRSTYTLSGPPLTATPVISPASQTFVGTISCTITCTTAGSTIFWSTAGTASTSDNIYTNTLIFDNTVSVAAMATSSVSPPSIQAVVRTYTRSSGDIEQVATPSISATTNVVESSVTVTVTCSTSGSSISVSTNGSAWFGYSSPITLFGSVTVDAIATKAGMRDSEVASASYGGGGPRALGRGTTRALRTGK